jgi:hypothetical protein
MLSKNSVTVLRIGLGLVFLANALTAWLAPQEFRDLIEGSFLTTMLPAVSSSVFIMLILINDGLLSLIFLFNLKFIKQALIWASIYLVLVILITWDPFGTLEHLGFLSMSIALFMEYK